VVFLPALVYEIGNGAITPIVALTALDLGASPSTAGYMVALLGIGQVLGDLPSAPLVNRIGERRTMLVGAGVAAAAFGVCLIARSLLLLGIALAVTGVCNAAFYLARQSYLTEVVPAPLRARAMSTLGGAHRVGLFIGPFIGAAAITLVATPRAAYAVAVGAALAAGVLLVVVADPAVPPGPVSGRAGVRVDVAPDRQSQVFATLGLAVLAVGAVRTARQTVLPLWAEHIGLSAGQTSLIFGITAAVDMALFYPAGKVMDRAGRLSIALPSMLILGAAVMAVPLTGTSGWLTLVATVMSFANGLGAGIIMTLGADAAPAGNPARFLSRWRLMSDTGNAAGPIVVSVVAGIWTLAGGIVANGSVGLLAAWGLAAWTSKYSPYATRAMTRQRRSAAAERTS
jgi:MFS family permease